MTPLQAAARTMKDLRGDVLTLEGLWTQAAIDRILTGMTVEPPITLLRQLTRPEQAMAVDLWPPELRGERAASLMDCCHMAIARRDTVRMIQLHDVWETVPVSPDWGEIAPGAVGAGSAWSGL